MIIEPNGIEGQFLADAKILNDSNMSFDKMNLSLVEGRIILNSKNNDLLQVPNRRKVDTGPELSDLGDYHIYSIGADMSLASKETIVTRLYTPRQIKFDKTYLFENNEEKRSKRRTSID